MAKTEGQESSSQTSSPKASPRHGRKNPTNTQIDRETNNWLWKIFFIVLAAAAVAVAIYIQMTRVVSENYITKRKIFGDHKDADTLIIAKNIHHGYLDHVIDRMNRFGHKISFMNSMDDFNETNISELQQYEILWFHDYPFFDFREFPPRARINHFPGTGFITSKMSISTAKNIPGLLPAFVVPRELDDFKEHVAENPHSLWVLKTNSHRGISALTAEEVLDYPYGEGQSMVQEFMLNPLLIDGRKFDIGIYAALTSVKPMRAYIYDDALLRFCSQPYKSSTGRINMTNIDTYVIGDDYQPIWLMNSLVKPFIGANLSMKRTLDYYLKQNGKNGAIIWNQIEQIIARAYKTKEPLIHRLTHMHQHFNGVNSTSVRGSFNQYFELVRFDFIVDENLNVFLMEANMSPNLSSAHNPPNRVIYEQVLNSFFSLVGITPYARLNMAGLPIYHSDGKVTPPIGRSSVEPNERFGLDDLIGDKELTVNDDLCMSDACHMNCTNRICTNCFFCLDYGTKLELRRAIYEQKFKNNFKRILPSTRERDFTWQTDISSDGGKVIQENLNHIEWFRAKCKQDKAYCNE